MNRVDQRPENQRLTTGVVAVSKSSNLDWNLLLQAPIMEEAHFTVTLATLSLWPRASLLFYQVAARDPRNFNGD